MTSAEIREAYLSFFEGHGHLRVPSASLVPAPDDTSTLLNVAGMQPFKPYFLGREQPPAKRLTSSQRCFRTPDIEEVGNTKRHLTYFEMLGNFSFGDYFKREATRFGWDLSTEGFGFDPDLIWVTVFGGDEELGLGPGRGGGRRSGARSACPRSASSICPGQRTSGRPERPGRVGRAPRCTSTEGPTTATRPSAPATTRSAISSTGTSSSCRTSSTQDGSITDLPNQNIDTGLGLERMCADPAGGGLGVRDRPLHAAHRARRGALRPLVRRRRQDHAGHAHPRRPFARAWSTCSPTESSRRTRTAATSFAGSCAARSFRAVRSGSRLRTSAASPNARSTCSGRSCRSSSPSARPCSDGSRPRRRRLGARSIAAPSFWDA